MPLMLRRCVDAQISNSGRYDPYPQAKYAQEAIAVWPDSTLITNLPKRKRPKDWPDDLPAVYRRKYI